MSKILTPYEVPIVYNDLSLPQTLEDVFFALEGLNKVIDDAFSKVEKRVNDEKQRVTQINDRLNTCSSKVKAIVGSTKATTIFSTAKFPGPKHLPMFHSVFNQMSNVSEPFREAGDEIYELPNVSKVCIGNQEMTTEINAIYCRLNTFNTDLTKVEFIMEDKGLGPLPSHLPTVGSLLLYNSNVNPYKNYQQLDNLEASGRMKAIQADEDKRLASAPTTLINGDMLPDVDSMDLNFRPEMGDISSFALPDNLPLNFIAGKLFHCYVSII